MSRFVYSLDRLLKLRKLQESQLEVRSRPIISKINTCLEDIQKFRGMTEKIYQHSQMLQLSSQKMVQYLSHTRDVSLKKIHSQQDQLQRYEQQYEKEYATLVRQARIRRKSLEILREKKLLEHRQTLAKNEEKEIEDHIFNKHRRIHAWNL